MRAPPGPVCQAWGWGCHLTGLLSGEAAVCSHCLQPLQLLQGSRVLGAEAQAETVLLRFGCSDTCLNTPSCSHLTISSNVT